MHHGDLAWQVHYLPVEIEDYVESTIDSKVTVQFKGIVTQQSIIGVFKRNELHCNVKWQVIIFLKPDISEFLAMQHFIEKLRFF